MKNEKVTKSEISRSTKKLFNQLVKLVETEYFQEQVRIIRDKLGVPQDGLIIIPEDKVKLGDMDFVPSNIDHYSDIEKRKAFLCSSNILTRSLTESLAIDRRQLSQAIKLYVFYGDLCLTEIHESVSWLQYPALCELEDLRFSLDEYVGSPLNVDPSLAAMYVEGLYEHTQEMPIALWLHPDASQTDICDFLTTNWDKIDSLRDKYAISSNRSVKNAKVNPNTLNRQIAAYVYKHRELTLKEISKGLKDEMRVIKSYVEVGKIKSLEIKRRQNNE